MRVLPDRLVVLLVVAAYLTLYTLAYANIIVPMFAYEGFRYEVPETDRIWILRVVAMLPALWIPSRLTRASHVAYVLIYLFVLIPIDLIPIYSSAVDFDDFIVFILVATGCFALIGFAHRLPLLETLRLNANPRVYWGALLITTIALFGAFFTLSGFRPRVVGLSEIYDVRADYAVATARGNRFFAYAVPFQGNVLDPLFLSYGLVSRRGWMVAVGVAGQMALFSITGFKSILFSAVILFCILLAIRADGVNFTRRALLGVIGLLSVALLAYVADLTTPATAELLNRVTCVSGLLTGWYYDFFSHHQHAYMGDGILSGLVDYRYPYDVPHLIGDVYLRNPRASANANFWADGYAHFGYAGVVGVSLALAVILWIYDCFTRSVDIRVAGLMIAIPALEVSNCGLQTTIVTHGLGMCLVLMLFYPRQSPAGNGSERPTITARPTGQRAEGLVV
jgi:hypothetical protein